MYGIAKVTEERDFLFSLLAVKDLLLVKPQDCDECHEKKLDWVVLNVCRHTLCTQCKESLNNTCPVCKLKYQPYNVIKSTCMKKCYSKVEQYAYKLLEMDSENEVLKNSIANERNDFTNFGAKRITPMNNAVLESRDQTREKINSKTKINNDNMLTEDTEVDKYAPGPSHRFF